MGIWHRHRQSRLHSPGHSDCWFRDRHKKLAKSDLSQDFCQDYKLQEVTNAHLYHQVARVSQKQRSWSSRESVCYFRMNSVQFSCSVMSDSLQPHGLQHARPPCPSPTPEAYSNSCPSNRWCHPTISSSVVPFSRLQSFPASGSFSESVLHIRWPILEFHLQHQSFQWIFRTDFPYDGLVGSPCCPRDSQESSPTPQFKSTNSLVLSRRISTWLLEKTKLSLDGPLLTTVSFNKLSRLVITFLTRRKCLLIHGCSHHLQWLNWLCLPNSVGEALTPGVTIFVDSAFLEVIKVTWCPKCGTLIL